MSKAFMFAGQGAQKVGMAGELQHLDKVKKLFELADKKINGTIELMLSGEQEELNKTVNTQPAMFIADLAYAYAAEEKGGKPDVICGFSVGEIPALCYAGALTIEDGLTVIAERARLMAQATWKHRGKMIAVIGLNSFEVRDICALVPECWAVNFNAPNQTVAAVSEASVEKLKGWVSMCGGKSIELKVSGAFHCPFMAEAAAGLEQLMKGIKFNKPEIDVYANLTAQPYSGDEDAMKWLLCRQVSSPVMFEQTISKFWEAGVKEFIEVGPGKVLTGLVSKIIRS